MAVRVCILYGHVRTQNPMIVPGTTKPGKMITMVKTAAINPAIEVNVERSENARDESMVSISFEKRLRMRPRLDQYKKISLRGCLPVGVVSNQRIVALMTLLSKSVNICFEALYAPIDSMT